ncbi:uncharacterized protein LOC128963906 [Oppia nitens]|uniref:uncharacterized protein LOC128963906 n=1 Tax=Oppia nitens TaxID=1686743 RepID=UPI0023DA4E8F|nr:uncharacterized protein LOC128963906 [Oppia nitens]
MATYGQLPGPGVRPPERKIRKCCGFSARFIRYFLFIFNFIFMASGLLILVLTLAYGRPYMDFGEVHLRSIQSLIPTTHLVNLIHWSMVMCGSAICAIALVNAIISCCSHSPDDDFVAEEAIELQSDVSFTSGRSAARNQYYNKQDAQRFNRRVEVKSDKSSVILCFFIFSLLFLFTLQLIIGLVSFISVTPNSEGKDEFMSSLTENLNVTQVLTSNGPQLESLYSTFKCCGWKFYDDYEALGNKSEPVPDACCKTLVDNCGHRKHPSNIYYDGCVHRFGPILKEYLLILGSVALGFSIVEVFGLIFSCCLYVQMAAY